MERISSTKKLSKGMLLSSEPFMMDQDFRRAVILLCSHDDKEGSVGFILNKKLDVNVDSLISDFPKFEAPVYFGGPVANETIHYIHDCGDILDESEEIADGIFWGGNFNKLKFLIKSELIKPHNIRFYLGYAGWSPMQLKDELTYGSWMLSEMHPNYILKAKSSNLWSAVVRGKGNTYSVISQIPNTSYLN